MTRFLRLLWSLEVWKRKLPLLRSSWYVKLLKTSQVSGSSSSLSSAWNGSEVRNEQICFLGEVTRKKSDCCKSGGKSGWSIPMKKKRRKTCGTKTLFCRLIKYWFYTKMAWNPQSCNSCTHVWIRSKSLCRPKVCRIRKAWRRANSPKTIRRLAGAFFPWGFRCDSTRCRSRNLFLRGKIGSWKRTIHEILPLSRLLNPWLTHYLSLFTLSRFSGVIILGWTNPLPWISARKIVKHLIWAEEANLHVASPCFVVANLPIFGQPSRPKICRSQKSGIAATKKLASWFPRGLQKQNKTYQNKPIRESR